MPCNGPQPGAAVIPTSWATGTVSARTGLVTRSRACRGGLAFQLRGRGACKSFSRPISSQDSAYTRRSRIPLQTACVNRTIHCPECRDKRFFSVLASPFMKAHQLWGVVAAAQKHLYEQVASGRAKASARHRQEKATIGAHYRRQPRLSGSVTLAGPAPPPGIARRVWTGGIESVGRRKPTCQSSSA